MVKESDIAFFNSLISQPAALKTADLGAAEHMLGMFPYCQILQFAEAKAKENIHLAALYAPQHAALHKFMTAPEELLSVDIIYQDKEKNPEEVLAQEADTEILEDPVEAALKIRLDQDQPEFSEDTDQLILENVVSADFFALEEKISEHKEEEIPSQEISRYNDDQMPYTFLWWLNKTRKEHADTYQPYVSFKLDTSEDIKKNISQETIQPIPDFDLQELISKPASDHVKAAKPKIKGKSNDLIERFIKEEPQIAPPSAEKIGNENKARKSSEDVQDLISETLAQIYTEQMLIDKAIETYRKLSLKFPEKSTYFADQIKILENKKI